MARGRKMMSDQLKWQLAEELGFAETLRREGWGGVSTRDTGNMVRLAIAKAEQMMSGRQ
jgi:small acid-soluble spore protein F (minor alpha/beta-type SASP)